jgi:hypothetical protein
MNDQIICPYCKKPFPVTEAFKHQMRDEFERQQKPILWQKALIAAEEKTKEKTALEIKDKMNEIEELRKQNRSLQEQLLEINKLLRQLKLERDQEKIENEKKLTKAQEVIKQQAKETAEKEYKFKILELEKKSQDAIKMVEEYKKKLEQGSQQLQGEVLELELETMLKKEFPYDEIQEVPKGVTGADIIQIVKNNYGKTCGSIIWESKRTKAWTESWIQKLRDDQRKVKADIAVLISQTLPASVRHFTLINGVWVGSFDSVLGLALLLRNSLTEIAALKSSMIGKQEKKEILWNYLTSLEFRQRLDSIYDAMNLAKEHLEKEKEFFRRKWAREEKNISLITENLLGMHGDLQAIVGKALPEISGLKILPKDSLF